jgi:hypothetical protein
MNETGLTRLSRVDDQAKYNLTLLSAHVSWSETHVFFWIKQGIRRRLQYTISSLTHAAARVPRREHDWGVRAYGNVRIVSIVVAVRRRRRMWDSVVLAFRTANLQKCKYDRLSDSPALAAGG